MRSPHAAKQSTQVNTNIYKLPTLFDAYRSAQLAIRKTPKQTLECDVTDADS